MVGTLAIAAAVPLAGCGGASTPAPVPVQQLFADAGTSGTGSYVSVLTATGHGNRHFAGVSLPGKVAVEMSCRGGRWVQARIDGRDWLKVWCAPAQAGGGAATFRRGSHLAVVASPTTRWSLVVAARRS